METVTIGCRLPNGYVLEIGLQTTAKAANGQTVARLIKLPNYARYVLVGTHGHTFKARQAGIQVPNIAGAEPFINKNVPKDLWEQWKKEHAKSWVLAKGQIFEVPGNANKATVDAMTIDAIAAGAAQFQPVDSSKPYILGNNKIEKLVREIDPVPVIACPVPPPQPVHGVVQFDNAEFIAAWPDFTGLSTQQNGTAFSLAALVLNNSCASIVSDADIRMTLLYMLTAHVAFLLYGSNDGTAAGTIPATGIVGRIAEAAQGSIRVKTDYASEIGESMAWFIQTKYGAMFWQATAFLRTAHYIPPPACGPNGPGFPYFSDIE